MNSNERLNFFPWYGGKHYFLKYLFPFPEHDLFIDVFGGSAVVLLNKVPSKNEIYNDINKELVNLWLVIQKAHKDFQEKCMKHNLDSRAWFEEYQQKTSDILENAFRFFYCIMHGFSGLTTGFHGYHDQYNTKQITYLNTINEIPKIWERIKFVCFECQDFRLLLKRFDIPNALWYLDPPYVNGGEQYEKNQGGMHWELKDLKDLSDILKTTKNTNWILSIDDKTYFNESNYYFQEVERINSVSKTHERSRSMEYIIRNFNPKLMTKQRTKGQTKLEF